MWFLSLFSTLLSLFIWFIVFYVSSDFSNINKGRKRTNNRKISQKQVNKRYILYVWGSINQKFLIMDNVFKYFNGFFKGLTGLIMTVLGLGVAVEILFGGGAMFGITVIDNVMNILNSLGGSGFAGLFGICVLFGLLRG